MGWRRRNMFYLTGLPGWIRFGFSPGWLGVSPSGLPPTASWLLSSGMMPQFLSYVYSQYPQSLPSLQGTTPLTPGFTPGTPGFTPGGIPFPATNELDFLKKQKELLESQLKEIEKRLKEMEG
ncbi:MAG: DUF5320 domain-containing protein [Candidatus Asgardarchaeia archaeon]